jgi:hypothetical protein
MVERAAHAMPDARHASPALSADVCANADNASRGVFPHAAAAWSQAGNGAWGG